MYKCQICQKIEFLINANNVIYFEKVKVCLNDESYTVMNYNSYKIDFNYESLLPPLYHSYMKHTFI